MRRSFAVPAAAAVTLACAALAAAGAGIASGRPRYGGTARVEIPGAIRTLDPASACEGPADCAAQAAIVPAIFETLTQLDEDGLPRALLAESWQSEMQDRRWQVRLRGAVTLHDGTTLMPADVASVLRSANPSWSVSEMPGGVRIESPVPMPDLPWQLADRRLAIAVRRGVEVFVGSGPFRVERWDAGKRMALAANENHRNGRPFLDGVQIDMGRPFPDELASLESGRADVVALQPADVRRAADRRLRVVASRPSELVALVFDARRPVASSEQVRNAVALAIDRVAIRTILLQRQGEAATSLLPDWLSGYAFVFRARYDRGAARSIVASLPAPQRVLTLSYPNPDPIAAQVADRIAVDVREAGLTVRTVAWSAAGVPPDARLLRVAVDGTTPFTALAATAHALGVSGAGPSDNQPSLEQSARFEQSVLEPRLVIPLVHLPRVYAIAARLACSAGSIVAPDGSLKLSDTWLLETRP